MGKLPNIFDIKYQVNISTIYAPLSSLTRIPMKTVSNKTITKKEQKLTQNKNTRDGNRLIFSCLATFPGLYSM